MGSALSLAKGFPFPGRGITWTAGAPTKLIDRPSSGTVANYTRTYDVSPDGKRFLMIKEPGAAQTPAPPTIVVVQNWTEELKRLVPTTR